jgi:hypothetical protein
VALQLLWPNSATQSNVQRRCCESGSRRAKSTHKNRKKINKFHFLKCWISLLRTENFFCSLNVLYGGLGIIKLQFLIKKDMIKNSKCIFKFFVIKTLNPDPDSLEMLDLDPDSIKSGSAPMYRYTGIQISKSYGVRHIPYVVYLLCVIVIATKNHKLRSRFG